MADRVVLAQGEGCECDAAALFGREAFERVFISYALSMIPDWQGALRQAARCVADGGKLEVVDFGQQDRLPKFWKQALFGWLARFHVAPRRSEEHTSELQSLMRISYAVFCLKKKNTRPRRTGSRVIIN